MLIRKKEFKDIPARRLRSIASGNFRGYKTAPLDISRCRTELRRRGLRQKI